MPEKPSFAEKTRFLGFADPCGWKPDDETQKTRFLGFAEKLGF
jgi:hypothetical protein